MAQVTVVVAVVGFGEVRTGLWCDQCALPSAIERDYRIVSGMNVLGAGTVWHCRDCGRQEGLP